MFINDRSQIYTVNTCLGPIPKNPTKVSALKWFLEVIFFYLFDVVSFHFFADIRENFVATRTAEEDSLLWL